MTALWERRRLVLSLILCLVVALGVEVTLRTFGSVSMLGATLSRRASPTASPTLALHETYAFYLESMPPTALAVGRQVTFRWVPVPQGTVSATSGPAALHCTLAFYGPYPSLADLTKATNPADGILLLGAPVFTAPPLTMSDWDTAYRSAEVFLPKALNTGYYLVESECLSARDNGTTLVGFPIQIVTDSHAS